MDRPTPARFTRWLLAFVVALLILSIGVGLSLVALRYGVGR